VSGNRSEQIAKETVLNAEARKMVKPPKGLPAKEKGRGMIGRGMGGGTKDFIPLPNIPLPKGFNAVFRVFRVAGGQIDILGFNPDSKGETANLR
jgi:hypothetical protein